MSEAAAAVSVGDSGPRLGAAVQPTAYGAQRWGSDGCRLALRSSDDMDGPVEDIGSRSCVTRFVKTLLSIMEHGVKPHSKHLTEYFAFLYEFAKMGEEEVR